GFAVARGAVRVKDLQGRVIVERLGLEGTWDGAPNHSDEAFILAEKGDLIIESVGKEEAVLYDAIRPVQGVPLPTPEPLGGQSSPSVSGPSKDGGPSSDVRPDQERDVPQPEAVQEP